MRRTLKVVFDEISDFTNAHGTFYSVGALFDDDSLLKANKKTRDAAQELRGILLQLVDIECDYYCDDAGQASTGRQMWKLKAILDAEGGSIYGKPPQNVGAGASGYKDREVAGEAAANPVKNLRTAPPTPTLSNKDDEIRAAVALKAAVKFVASRELAFAEIFSAADQFELWLKSKSSGSEANSTPAPQGAGSPGRESAAPSTGPDPSAAVESSASSPPGTPPAAGTSSGGSGVGEGSAPAGTISSWDERKTFQDDWVAKGLIEPENPREYD